MTTTEQQLMWALFLCGALIVALGFAVAQIAALMKTLKSRDQRLKMLINERQKAEAVMSETLGDLKVVKSMLDVLKARLENE